MSRTTVRAALAALSGEGLVVTRKGFGSYVRDRQPLRRVSSTHRHASIKYGLIRQRGPLVALGAGVSFWVPGCACDLVAGTLACSASTTGLT